MKGFCFILFYYYFCLFVYMTYTVYCSTGIKKYCVLCVVFFGMVEQQFITYFLTEFTCGRSCVKRFILSLFF